MSIFKIIVHHSETFSNTVIPPIFSKSFEQKLLAALAFLPKSRNNEEKLLSYFFAINLMPYSSSFRAYLFYSRASQVLTCKGFSWRAC